MPANHPFPLTDPARLAALHGSGLLDAPIMESFDRLTRLAAAALRAPVAVVSLLDADRQFFLSATGLGEPWASARQTPLSHSFCQHVVSSGEPLLVADARRDPLVRDNPAILALGIVAYAGVPLLAANGQVLGCFNASDTTPRHWTDAEVALLRDFATLAQTEIALRATLHRGRETEATLRAGEARFRSLVQHAADIIAVLDADGTIRDASPALARVLGHDSEAINDIGLFALIHPDDLPVARRAFTERRSHPGPGARHELRLRHRDGSWRTLEIIADNLLDDESVRGIVVNARDVTERRRAEAALRESAESFESLFNASDEGIAIVEGESIVAINRGYSALLGFALDDVVGATAHDLAVPDERPGMVRRDLADPDRPYEILHRRKAGAPLPVEISGTTIRYQGRTARLFTIRDISARKAAEAELHRREQEFRALAEHAPDIIARLDTDLCYTYINPAIERVTGIPPWAIIGTRVGGIEAPAAQRNDRQDAVRRVLETGQEQSVEFTYPTPEGDRRYQARLVPETDPGGAIASVLYIARDITALAQAQAALRAREEQFRYLFTRNPHPMWVYDNATLAFLEVNEAAVAHYGYTRAEFLAMRLTDIRSPEESARLLVAVEASNNQGGILSGHWQHRLKDGRVRTVTISSQMLDWAGRSARLAVVQDITERQALEEQLRHQAFHDALTELPNRAAFMAHFARLPATHADPETQVAVLFLDLDGFKLVNDSLGHAAGDRLLTDLAGRLRAAVRPGDLVARFGGDEFSILLPGVADATEAAQVAGRLLHALRLPYTIAGQDVVIACSIGIALGYPARVGAEELLRRADLALHQAKLEGKARWHIFAPALDTRVQERLTLEADLRRALERAEFVMVYQPLVDLASGCIVGTEALVRWHNPERGPVPPHQFIPIAEETGLIVPLGRWILATACRQAVAWAALAPDAPPPTMSVNLSAREFEDSRLLIDVAEVLAQTGLPPSSLQLEITEGVAMDDAAATIVTLQELKTLGVCLAIDDFGTGYSSLTYLQRFPVDVLKVDKAFVDGLGHGPRETAIVEAVVTLGHALGLRVTAEGVETAAQAAHLRALGCDTGQGYHFARPLSPDAAGHLLAQRTCPPSDARPTASPALR